MRVEAGNKILKFYREKLDAILVVDRVTATQAISGNMKFKIEATETGYCHVIADANYNMYSYYIESDLNPKQIKRATLEGKVKAIKVESLSDEVLSSIVELANQFR